MWLATRSTVPSMKTSWKVVTFFLILVALAITGVGFVRWGGAIAMPSGDGFSTATSHSKPTSPQAASNVLQAPPTPVPAKNLSLGAVIMDTPNDPITTEEAAAPGDSSQTDLLKLGEADANRPAQYTCSSTRRSFMQKFHTVAENHKQRSPTEPDRWAGRYPMCGIHGLYNLTGIILMASGAEVQSTTIGRKSTFKIENCGVPVKPVSAYISDASAAKDRCHDVYLAVRLHGPTIVAGIITQRPDCNFDVEYTLYDPGVYVMEVRVVWLDGLRPEKAKSRIPITLRKTHSKWGKKPHQKYGYNAECEEQTHIIGSPFKLVAAEAKQELPELSLAKSNTKPVCGRSHNGGAGRWVKNENSKPCLDDSAVCVGDPALINDVKPFNENYLWAPLQCKMQFWKHGDGPKGNCTSRPGTLLLMGDSTTREYAQNFRFFNMGKAGLKVVYANWRLEHQWYNRKMAKDALQGLAKELKQSKPVVLAANLGPLHLIAGLTTDDWKYYVDQWHEAFKDSQETHPFIERKIFLGPSTIHYATNAMSAQRMLLWISYAKEKLIPIGFEFIDAWTVTSSKPESSWDGVHYAAERGKAQMKHVLRAKSVPQYKWNGGVSVMLTTMLINLLCNP